MNVFRKEPTSTMPLHLEPAASHGKALSILLIEDNSDSAELMQLLLEMVGHRVMIAGNGTEALELARAPELQVVICDIGLPGGLSGFDVARALRRDPQTRELRLIALSGYDRAEDKAKSHDAGFDEHLVKPVDMRLLASALQAADPRA